MFSLARYSCRRTRFSAISRCSRRKPMWGGCRVRYWAVGTSSNAAHAAAVRKEQKSRPKAAFSLKSFCYRLTPAIRPTGSISRLEEAAMLSRRLWRSPRLESTALASAWKRATITALGSCFCFFIDTSCVLTFGWIVLLTGRLDKPVRRIELKPELAIPGHNTRRRVFHLDFDTIQECGVILDGF